MNHSKYSLSNRHSILLILFLILFTGNVKSQNTEPLLFEDDNTVCFIGNSITHGGWYHTFLQTYWATRYPTIKVNFINCGISGDGAWGMLERFEEDILVHQPQYAFLMTGMNDVLAYLYETDTPDSANLAKRQKAIDNYKLNTEKLAKLMIENNIIPIFITPTIYDETAVLKTKPQLGKNAALGVCAEHIEHLASKYNARLIDFYSLLNKINTTEQKKDSSFTIIGSDRVHPKEPGHLVMAYEMIKTLFPVENVSAIELNAKKGKVISNTNCDINVLSKGKALEFTALEEALPFAYKNNLHSTLELIPYHDPYNQQIVKIKNLKKGNYKLVIDTVEIATFSSDELTAGINLAEYSTSPQYQQAMQIMELSAEYKEIQNLLRVLYMFDFKHFRSYSGKNTLEAKRAFMDAKCETQKGKSWYPYMIKTTNEYFKNITRKDQILQSLEDCRDKIFTLNQPVIHTYKLNKL